MSDGFDLLEVQRRVFRSGLRPMERLVALALLDHWSPRRPKPWPSIPTLEQATGLGRRAVMTAVQGLTRSGAVRVELRRPTQDGKPDGVPIPGAKPTNHYDLSGLMRLPGHEKHRCTKSTGAADAPVHQKRPTRARKAPSPVHEEHPKEPSEGTKEGTKLVRRAEPDSRVLEVFEFWRADTTKPKAKLDMKRKARIQARLRDGFSVDELKQAIRNRRHDPWLMGEDPRSPRVFDGLETLLRDTAQVERLRDLVPARAHHDRDGQAERLREIRAWTDPDAIDPAKVVPPPPGVRDAIRRLGRL